MAALTSSSPPPGTSALLHRLQLRANDMIKESALDSSDALRALPSEIRLTELPWVTRRTLSTVFRALGDNVAPSAHELRPAREIAVQRADEGVPLSVVIRNWQAGFQRFWTEAAALARPEEGAEVAYLGTALISLFGTFSATLVDAYEQEQMILDSEKSSAGHLVARMILDGQEARPYADRFRIELAAEYHVLALAIAPTTDELVDDATGRLVAGRRKMRSMLSLPEFRRATSILTTLGPAGGHLLLPADPHATASTLAAAAELVERIRSSVGVAVRAGLVETVAIADVPSAGTLAAEVLRLSAGHRSERSVYRLADVALDFQLTRPGPAADHVGAVLAPIEPFPELIAFLQEYLRCDMDRGRTARALGVHPNTINNRLHRVASLSGIDPSGFVGVMAFGAALTVAASTPRDEVSGGFTGKSRKPANQSGISDDDGDRTRPA
ncbi:PucR family transcriptional regulator [Gordonia sp. DT218]|uniref:PucR family transcriptional regulator n=1 Tax=Gordonia sp. DT218 TaxID=3416659 RepID=UPI003CF32432